MSIQEPFIDYPREEEKRLKRRDISTLLYKNFLNLKQSKKIIMILFLSPLLMCLLMTFLQYISNTVLQRYNASPPVQSVRKFQEKREFQYQIGYSIIGEQAEWIDYTISYIKNKTDFNDHQLVKNYQNDTSLFNDLQVISNIYYNNPSDYRIGIIFCTSEKLFHPLLGISCLKNPKLSNTAKLKTYFVVYNSTETNKRNVGGMTPTLPKAEDNLSLKLMIDNALISYVKWKKKNKDKIFDPRQNLTDHQDSIDLTQQIYPQIINRLFKGIDIGNDQGGFFFLIPIMFSFLYLTQDITKENDLGLKSYLNVIGVSHFKYWTSWFITSLVYNFLIASFSVIFGNLFSFEIFTQTPFWIHFLLFFGLSFSMNSLSFLLAVCCSTQKLANSICYGLLLFSFVIQGLLNNVILIHSLYGTDIDSWVKIFEVILSLYPQFNYSKIWGEIGLLSGTHLDVMTFRRVHGPGFTLDDYFKQQKGRSFKSKFIAPSIFESNLILFGNGILIFVISWYLDNILNREQKPWFFLTKNYWIVDKKTKKSFHFSDKNIEVFNISKSFKQGLFFKKETKVLKDVSFYVENGELLSILGHNGAGKTTITNIMTGKFLPDEGKIYINGLSLRNQRNLIMEMIAVCPQFDILWNNLTPIEHLKIYSSIKCTNFDASVLDQVNLSHVKNAQVSTFSGGMKRRLSILLSSLGKPKIIFLDEPTTGMDVKSRRQVWHLIQNMKKGNQGVSIIMTTHAMEEAEYLSDRIMIMDLGQLKCIGTSLKLKNEFGDGYKLKMIVDQLHTKHIIQIVRESISSSKLLSSSGGSLIFSIPFDGTNQLKKFIQKLEHPQAQKSQNWITYISDWDLSNTTLEEIFIKITGQQSVDISKN